MALQINIMLQINNHNIFQGKSAVHVKDADP